MIDSQITIFEWILKWKSIKNKAIKLTQYNDLKKKKKNVGYV